MTASLAQRCAALAPDERAALLDDITDGEAAALELDWQWWARPKQIAPAGDWRIWLMMAGRGGGKTRAGAEWVRDLAETGQAARIALVGATAADVRDVMIEGESGLLAIAPPDLRPDYQPSKRRVVWKTGAIAHAYSADEPNRLRGPQHDAAWADELAAWRYPDAWDQLRFGVRLGSHPRTAVTTTPRPVPLILDLLERDDVAVASWSTFENAANLAPSFLDELRKRYEGTQLGRQEIYAEVLREIEGALWRRAWIEAARVRQAPPADAVHRIVVGVDPAVTGGAAADETGIVVGCLADCWCRGSPERHVYVLDDMSLRGSPDTWAQAVVRAYRLHGADRVVAEVNQGGDMVETLIRQHEPGISYRSVHATQGKRTRAEPVAALYEQGIVHHVGTLAKLEDQMCSYVQPEPGKRAVSPDRMDALVWALHELVIARRAVLVA
ncbi:MAG: terminase family protein [Desulfuromonadales bacterium]|nr:terminase family protein [Desulfuromonadales bacterium]